MGRLRTRIDRHRIAGFPLITYAFPWPIQAVVVAAGTEPVWTTSILIGFVDVGQSVGAALVVEAPRGARTLAELPGRGPRLTSLLSVAVLVVLVSGSRRLADREVPDRKVPGLD